MPHKICLLSKIKLASRFALYFLCNQFTVLLYIYHLYSPSIVSEI